MIDKLIEDIQIKKNPSAVGLDPSLQMMPEYLKEEYFGNYGNTPEAVGELFAEFNRRIIDAVSDIVPAVKPQIAMYEKYGLPGLHAYMETCRYAAEAGLTVIGDIKRGDISSTAAAYAAHLGGTEIGGQTTDLWKEDAVTVNPYMGSDGIHPFIQECLAHNKGIFILVRTSNPSSSELQELKLEDGRRLFEAVADLTARWGEECTGSFGYSNVGAVVGATHRAQGEALRVRMKHTFFLVPGYGAQGGTAEDVAGFFDQNALGAVISSSRGITAAYQNNNRYGERNFAEAAAEAAVSMRDDLRRVLFRS